MKYLAFDIEAANGFQPSSICSLGIVLADENFKVLDRENIWINPKTKYNLNGTRENVGIDLHLNKEVLDSSPDFSQIFPKIEKILTDKNVTVIGHAVDSDVRMLNAACKRYKLPSINFKFVCSQLLYKLYKGEKDIKALNKIACDLNLTYNEHNSLDDAWMCLKTLEYVVSNSKLTLTELLNKYSVRMGENNNFELTRSVCLNGQQSKRAVTTKQLNKLKEFCLSITPKQDGLAGHVFAVARSLELLHSDNARELLKIVLENGGRYTTRLKNCNCYLLADTPTKEDLLRERRVQELAQQGQVKIFTPNQLFELKN